MKFESDPVHRSSYAFEERGDDLVVTTVLEPGGVLPKHHHPRQREVWWVLSGEVRFYLDGRWQTLGAASGRITVPAGITHGLENQGGEPAELKAEVEPALGLRGFLTESAAAGRDGLFRKGGIPTGIRGARWVLGFLDRYGDDVVMAFPPGWVQRALRPLAGRANR